MLATPPILCYTTPVPNTALKMAATTKDQQYWRSNLLLVAVLLSVWFLFSCVLSIWLVEDLNKFKMAGFPVGFWIAQQGSIVVFIFLVLIYALSMRHLDRKYGVDKERKS